MVSTAEQADEIATVDTENQPTAELKKEDLKKENIGKEKDIAPKAELNKKELKTKKK